MNCLTWWVTCFLCITSSTMVLSAPHHDGSERKADTSANDEGVKTTPDPLMDKSLDFGPSAAIVKREVEDESFSHYKYYPMVLTKKAANGIQRLLLGLRAYSPQHSASENQDFDRENDEIQLDGGVRPYGSEKVLTPFQLQRHLRGEKSRSLKCYFNAVSCFKKRK